jgi:hypothetical protein
MVIEPPQRPHFTNPVSRRFLVWRWLPGCET